MSREERFTAALKQLGCSFDGGLKRGGDYAATVRHGDQIYVSGQIPRVDDAIVHSGTVGTEISLDQAQDAARICALRCLALLREQLGSLDAIKAVLRITVFVQSADTFSQQSEVANGASSILHSVLGEAGAHTRTSVGVYRLPKNAPVEIDLIAVAIQE
ncbi:RidA family protein [Pseudomonas sp. KU26590]|uniref:RidA family protein n=1 Tax=Pseudomonas sp. KU26590 TaxID=2991051 RepID=UPI00223D3BA2|nr:RidA family protein [Pseudomonas sp. KU26590]UZJ59893.1 RidA family protein [Pseudomonas sp. KU26590]